jgi:hypothetical protein
MFSSHLLAQVLFFPPIISNIYVKMAHLIQYHGAYLLITIFFYLALVTRTSQ